MKDPLRIIAYKKKKKRGKAGCGHISMLDLTGNIFAYAIPVQLILPESQDERTGVL